MTPPTGSSAGSQPPEDGKVIVDATFHRRSLRDAFRSALGTVGSRVVFVECVVPAAELERRVRARARDPHRVSDATTEILRRQLAGRDPLDEVPAHRHVVLRADQSVEALAAQVEEAVDLRAMLSSDSAPPVSGELRTARRSRPDGARAGAA